MYRRKEKTLFVIMTIALLSFSLLIFAIVPLGHDLWYHLYRLGAMGVELQKHPFHLPIRILSDSFNQYGYGAALYYGDFFLYPFAVLCAFGVDVVISYRLLILFIFWMTFGIAYCSYKMLDKSTENAFLFGFCYTLSTSALINLCIRSAIGESLALAFFPMLFFSFYNLLHCKKGKNSWILLGIAMSGIILSHMLSALLTSAVMGIWLLFDWKKLKQKSVISNLCKSVLLTVGLTASFILPMLEQMLFQKVQTPTNSAYQKQAFLEYSLDIIDFFAPYEIKKILVQKASLPFNIDSWHPGTVGIFAIFLCFIMIKNRKQISKEVRILWWVSVVALISLGIKLIMNIEKEFLSFMQFPWRILPLIFLGFAVVATALYKNVNTLGAKLCIVLMILFCACYAIGTRYAYQLYVQRNQYEYILNNNPEVYHKYFYKYDPNMADALYLPQGVSMETYETRGESITSSHSDCQFDWKRTKDGIDIAVQENPVDETVLTLPLYLYKGYKATDSIGQSLSIVKQENGLVNVVLPKGQAYQIEVSYGGTIVQTISDGISLVTSLFICVIIIHGLGIFRQKNKKEV